GFTIARESPELGVLETEWAENRAKLPEDFVRRTIGRMLENLYSTGERDKFRMRIDRAGSGSEVYIAHSGLREVYTSELQDSTGWEHRPSDPGLEVEFLRRLLVRLGASQEQSEQMMAGARSVQSAERARLVGAGPEAVVRIDEPFDRAWRRVALGLDRAGFTVEDRNRAAGHFYVRYIDPEVQAKSRGFFARMFGGDPDAPTPRQFRIELVGAGQSSDVRVRGTGGEPVSGAVDQALAERMLAVIRDELK
ncbi:MAG: outer membrane protein assembly factor BamC, partial [Burkholderiales bacterium]